MPNSSTWKSLSSALMSGATRLSERIERLHPPMAAGLLSFASRLAEPPFLEPGLELRELSDHRVWASLSSEWRHQLADGEISRGHLALLAEFAMRSWLQRHLDEPFQHASLIEFRLSLDTAVRGEVWARLEIADQDLLAWSTAIRRASVTQREFQLLLLSSKEKRLGEAWIKVKIDTRPALEA